MAGEHGGTGQGQPSEDHREFRRMMDAAGREGLLRMIEHLTEEIRANPDDTEALLARGLAYSELGEYRRAAEDNGRIIALDPENADAYFERARAYSELAEHRAAVVDYGNAIRLAPGDAVAHYSRGACNAQMGNLVGAISDFDVAVLLAPDNADPYYDRGVDLCRDGRAPAGGGGPEPGH